MMDNDEFLDWLEGKRDRMEAGIQDDAAREVSLVVMEELISDFNREFDTRDSPYEPPSDERKLKKKKGPSPEFPYGEGNQGPGTGPDGERLI